MKNKILLAICLLSFGCVRNHNAPSVQNAMEKIDHIDLRLDTIQRQIDTLETMRFDTTVIAKDTMVTHVKKLLHWFRAYEKELRKQNDSLKKADHKK